MEIKSMSQFSDGGAPLFARSLAVDVGNIFFGGQYACVSPRSHLSGTISTEFSSMKCTIWNGPLYIYKQYV